MSGRGNATKAGPDDYVTLIRQLDDLPVCCVSLVRPSVGVVFRTNTVFESIALCIVLNNTETCIISYITIRAAICPQGQILDELNHS